MVAAFYGKKFVLTNINQKHIIHIDNHQCEVKTVEISEKESAVIFKAFCDENRIKIIKILATGEKCACKLLEELNVSQPTLSHHMKILCDSKIVNSRKEGKWTHYSISKKGISTAQNILLSLTENEQN